MKKVSKSRNSIRSDRFLISLSGRWRCCARCRSQTLNFLLSIDETLSVRGGGFTGQWKEYKKRFVSGKGFFVYSDGSQEIIRTIRWELEWVGADHLEGEMVFVSDDRKWRLDMHREIQIQAGSNEKK